MNYVGKQLVNGVSVSEDLTYSRQVFRVKIRFLLEVKEHRPIRDNTYLHTLAINRVHVAE